MWGVNGVNMVGGYGMTGGAGMAGLGGGDAPQKISRKPIAGVAGAWECPSCNNVNYAIRTHCNRCAKPRPAQDVLDKQASRAPAVRANGEPIEGVDGNWSCTACKNINFGKREACNRCGAPKPTKEEIDARHAQLAEERGQDVAAGFAPRGMEGAMGYECLPTNPNAPGAAGRAANAAVNAGMSMAMPMTAADPSFFSTSTTHFIPNTDLSLQPLPAAVGGPINAATFQPQDSQLQARVASLEATVASLQPLLPQLMQLQSQMASLQNLVTQQAHVLATANVKGPTVQSPSCGMKRAAEGMDGQDSKRQELGYM